MNNENYYKVESIIKYLSDNFKTQPELDELAEKFDTSSFHLQKTFTEWVGISPKKFLQYLTTNYLKSKIYDSKSIDATSDSAGLSSQSRVYDLFTKFEGMTPNEYKKSGENIQIEYGFYPTIFGECLIGLTERGICHLSFTDDNAKDNINQLKLKWSKSKITENQEKINNIAQDIFKNNQTIKLFLKGTNFQIKSF